MNTITHSDITELLETQELPSAICKASPIVVVVFTQGWCPDWHRAKVWLEQVMPTAEGVSVFVSIYDEVDAFEQLRSFKEQHWKNPIIPYFRFYKDGLLQETYNIISERKFYRIIQALKSDQ